MKNTIAKILIGIIITLVIGTIILLINNGVILNNGVVAYKIGESHDGSTNNYLLKDYDDYLARHITGKKLSKSNFDNNSYAVINVYHDSCGEKIYRPDKVEIVGNYVRIYVPYRITCGGCASSVTTYLVRIPKVETDKEITVIPERQNNPQCNDYPVEVKKPVIYLYPEEDMDINVRLDKDKLLVSYPKYEDGWNVHATKEGKLTYNNKEYYALYYEAKANKLAMKDEGFVIKGEETADFLDKTLTKLGLNYKEKEEFIIYWLPILEKNKYNYLYFETNVDNIMPLYVEPKPDTSIRILMEYLPLKNKINVKEQSINKVQRKGYTLVEWGGTKIDN